jgi:hypothetical protein
MNFEHTSLLQQPAQQPPYSATENPQHHFRQQLSPTAVYSEGGGGCNSSESSAMLLDAGQHHRVVSCGQQQRGGLLSEQQQQQMGHNSSLYDWDINDPDIPAKVHLYVSTNLFFLRTRIMKFYCIPMMAHCNSFVLLLYFSSQSANLIQLVS